MNKKIVLVAGLVAVMLLTGFSCTKTQTTPTTPTVQIDVPKEPETLTYLVSEQDALKFCDGANMDSDGYRKSITKEVTSNVPKEGLTLAQMAKQTAILATSGNCQTALKELDFKVADGVVTIPAIEGWAGVSIALCSCKPEVEVNLLRLPGIKQVLWATAPVPVTTEATDCDGFSEKLSACDKFKCQFRHPLTGGNMQREITGIVSGKCNYVEQMPNGGKMVCNYTESQRKVAAEYYKKVMASEQAIGDTENPLQTFSDTGVCVVTGY